MAKKKKEKAENIDTLNFKDKEKVSNNPFTALDKNNFRVQKEKTQKSDKDKKHKLMKEEKITNLNHDFESDEDMFLTLIGNVRNIDIKEKDARFTHEPIQAEKQTNTIKKEESSQKEHTQEQIFSLANTLGKNLPQYKERKSEKEKRAEKLPYKENTQTNKILTDEDEFFAEMRDVAPLNKTFRIPPSAPEEVIIQKNQALLMHDFEEGKLEFSLSANQDHVQCNILGLDILTLANLQNRNYVPEAHLDLHGLKAHEAFHALVPFLKGAYYKDYRCVLIITGKGINSYDNRPLLRTKVTEWLIDEPFKRFVLAFCTAQQEDGGSGALYVLLRKRRKNSPPILWERVPRDYDIWADLDRI